MRRKGARTAVSTVRFFEGDALENDASCGGIIRQPSETEALFALNGASPFGFILGVELLWVISWPATNSASPVLVVSISI